MSSFISDIRHRYRGIPSALNCLRSDGDAKNYTLLEVKDALDLMGSASLSDFGLPESAYLPLLPQGNQTPHGRIELLREEVNNAIPLYNADQKSLFNEMIGAVLPGVTTDNINASVIAAPPATSKAFFLDSPAGTGRTFLTRAIHAFIRLRSKKVIAVARSTVAAALLDGGGTAHSTFKIPIPCDHGSSCNVSASSQLVRQLQEADLFLWDEAVMAHKYSKEAVHRMLQDITKSSPLFGGKTILFIECFRQILPVIKDESRSKIVQACIKASELFAQFRILRLSENMRLEQLGRDPHADPTTLEYPDFLLRLGEGRLEETGDNDVLLPSYVNTSETLSELCSSVFESIEEHWNDTDWLTSRAVLVTKNVKLGDINEMVGSRIPGEIKTYRSADSVENNDLQAQVSAEIR